MSHYTNQQDFERRSFCLRLNTQGDEAAAHLLSAETAEELCAIVEFASPRIKELILRELRSGE